MEEDDDALLVCLAAAFELFFALFDFFDQPLTSFDSTEIDLLADDGVVPKAAPPPPVLDAPPFCPGFLVDLVLLLMPLPLLRLDFEPLLRFIVLGSSLCPVTG